MEKREIWNLLEEQLALKVDGKLRGPVRIELKEKLIKCAEDVLKSNDARLIYTYSNALGTALPNAEQFVDAIAETGSTQWIWEFLLHCKEDVLDFIPHAEEKLLRAYNEAEKREIEEERRREEETTELN